MRKFLTAAMATALSFSMIFTSMAATKLATPTVRWHETREAVGQFTRIPEADGQYEVDLWKDGVSFHSSTHHFPITSTAEYHSPNFLNDLDASGIYKFRVMALGDGNNTLDSEWSDFSENWTFTKPNISFGKPANLHWEGAVACWDAPSDSVSAAHQDSLIYEVELLENGNPKLGHNGVHESSVDFIIDNENFMDDKTAEYTFKVRAISNKPSEIFHGEWVTSTDAYDISGENNAISSKLDELLGADSTSNAPDVLASQDIKKVAIAMDSDEAVLEDVKALEEKYTKEHDIKTGINVSADAGIAEEDIKVVGMGLNAATTGSPVTFQVSKPEKDVPVDSAAYKNSIQFSFHLDGAHTTLKVPVQITLPVPANVNPDHFVILHYKQDGTVLETLTPKLNEDKTLATITVTSFSVFVFAEQGMDMAAIATPSNAATFKALADALPESSELAGLENEEAEAVVSGALKLSDALKNHDTLSNSLFDEKELLEKLDAVFTWANEFKDWNQGRISDSEGVIEDTVGLLAASGKFGMENVSIGVKAELASPSNASEKLSFTLSMYAVDADGKETEIKDLNAPMWFYLSIPEEYKYAYKSSHRVTVSGGRAALSYDEATGRLVLFTNGLGKFSIRATGSSGSSSGGSSKGSSKPRVIPSPEGGKWVLTNNSYYYQFANGKQASDCWLHIKGVWYHFGSDGKMTTGWYNENQNYYYLNPASGAENGAMMTGWQLIDGKWYFFNPNGDGFQGTMLFNTTTPDGYTVNADGQWIQ